MFQRNPDDPVCELALEALEAGITAAQPATVLQEQLTLEDATLSVEGASYDLDAYEEVVVLGGGNAAGRVASCLAALLGDYLTDGVIVTDDPAPAGPIEMIDGTHPIPSAENVEGTRRLLGRARTVDEDTLVLVAITGGGSALLSAPTGDVSLADLQDVTNDLLRSGAPIDRINAVRKHVSALKGGQLARQLAPATVVTLVFSDVTSGDPSVVASGPVSPDPTTYEDALATLTEYGVDAPSRVTDHLQTGADGGVAETPAPGDPAVTDGDVFVLADNVTALSAAAEVCEQAGFEAVILSSSIRGEAREAAKTHVAIAEEVRRTGNPVSPPVAILSGGETTVTITGDGIGGPNQEFGLSAAIQLPDDVVLGAIDTDGIDGVADAAGALVTSNTVTDTHEARKALSDNDAYEYLRSRDALLVSNQTGTNVNDLRVLLVPDR